MINFDTVPANAVASATFLEQKGVRSGYGSFLVDHKLILVGQYNSGYTPTDNTPQLLDSAAQALTLYGPGSMLHLMAKRAFEQAPNVPIYALPVADAGGGTDAAGSVVVSGTATSAGTISLFIAGKKIQVSVASGDTANTVASAIRAAITADTHLPVLSGGSTGTVSVTAKNAGTLGNGIKIYKDLDYGDSALEPAGITLTIAQLTGGATDPDITTALANLGGTWYTAIACPYTDATNVPALEAAAEVRAAAGVKMPFLGVIGYTGTRSDFVVAVTARNSKFVSWVPVEASPTWSAAITACAAALYVARQSTQPGTPMRGRTLIGVRAGIAALWTYAQLDAAVKAGGSTTLAQPDGTVKMEDFVTTNKTDSGGAADDTYRFVNWLGNWQIKLNSLDVLFRGEPFVDAVVVDDNAVTSLSFAVSPRVVKSYVIDLIDGLWVPLALTTNRDAVVGGIVCEINNTNPGRIDVLIPDVFSAGLRIIAGKVQWSFYAPATV